MTVAEVNVGATYSAKINNNIVPVTLTETCPYGGWYGTNDTTGERIRVTTARLIGPSDSKSNITVQEDNNMPTTTTRRKKTTARNTAQQNRAARRAAVAANTTTTVHNIEESTVPTVKITNKPAAKRTTKPKAPAKPAAIAADSVTMSVTDLNALVAAKIAEALNGSTPAPAAKTTTKRATASKPVTVKLKATGGTANTIKFEYTGTAEEPLVTAVYLTLPMIERFAGDGSPVEVNFTHYVPTGKQKPMPKSKIRYRGTADTIRDIYVSRTGITKLGYTESVCPVVTVKVVSDDEISLTFPKA